MSSDGCSTRPIHGSDAEGPEEISGDILPVAASPPAAGSPPAARPAAAFRPAAPPGPQTPACCRENACTGPRRKMRNLLVLRVSAPATAMNLVADPPQLPGFVTGSDFSITCCTSVKIAVVAPIPSPSVTTAVAVNPGDFLSCRNACLSSGNTLASMTSNGELPNWLRESSACAAPVPSVLRPLKRHSFRFVSDSFAVRNRRFLFGIEHCSGQPQVGWAGRLTPSGAGRWNSGIVPRPC